MDWAVTVDHWLFEKINHDWTTPTLDRVMPILTDLHRHIGPYTGLFLMCVLGFWLYRQRGKALRVLIASVLSFAAADATAYRLIKPYVNRNRPENVGIPVVLKVHSHSGSSFPSNHASNLSAVARAISYYYPHLRWWAFAGAVIGAYSRVYVGVHFPIDVLAGSLLGFVLSSLVLWLLARVERRFCADPVKRKVS